MRISVRLPKETKSEQELVRKWDFALFATLAFSNPNDHATAVNVRWFKVDGFGKSKSTQVNGGEKSVITCVAKGS